MDIMQQLQLGKFLSPEDAQMYDPLIQMLARGGQATPSGERGATSTDREIAQAQKSRGPVRRSGGGGGAMPSSQSGLPTPEMQLTQLFAQAGDLGPASALGQALGYSSDGSITGARRYSDTMNRAFATASPHSSMGWDSGDIMEQSRAGRKRAMGPASRGGFGSNIKPYDSTANHEYMDRQRELRYRNEDARFEDRRRRDLLNMILGATGGNLNEQRITEGDQYVNSAGAWKRMPTREVETKTISPLDILRMLGG